MKYTDIPALIKQAQEAAKSSANYYKPLIVPAAGMATGTAASLLPGSTMGKPLIYDAIASGWLPVLATGAWAINKNYNDKKKLDAAGNAQLEAAQNAADNTARASQKRYNAWRTSRGMAPIEYYSPEDWRYNPTDPGARGRAQNPPAIDTTENVTQAPQLPKSASFWDASTYQQALNFYNMTPQQQLYYYGNQPYRPMMQSRRVQQATAQQAADFAAEQDAYRRRRQWQRDRAVTDAGIRYRDSAVYQAQPRRNTASKVMPARMRYAKAIEEQKKRDAEFAAKTYKGKGYGSVGTGSGALSFGMKPNPATAYAANTKAKKGEWHVGV